MALIERSPGLNVASALATRATSDPERDFLLFGGRSHSYGEIDSQADSLAAALAHLGVEAGDRIALVLPPCPEFVVALFAAAKLGAVVVPLNPRLTPPELHYMLRHSEAVCAVTVERDRGVDYLQIFEELIVQLPELQYLVTVGEEDLWYDDRIFQFEDLVSAGTGRDYPTRVIDPRADCFAILYTSGTMGEPKGVELSHENVLSVAAATAEAIGLTADDRIVGVTALFHVFGLGPGVLSTVLTGAALVLYDPWAERATPEVVERYRATVHYGVPTLFVRALRDLDDFDREVSSLRLAVVAGAPVSDELLREIEERLAPIVLVAYSLTEMSSTVCVSRPQEPREKRIYTVGRALPGNELRIVDDEGGVLPEESIGEITVRGPGGMLGYYRQPGATAAAFDSEGFLLTGDLGMIDEEGFVHLVGRRKEVIIRSGFNVYPREVEARIASHPAVGEVAVVGVADTLLGEAICACVVPREGAIVTGPEIVDWCRMTLADDKVPDLVRFLDEMPRTGTGKVRRADLSRAMTSEG